MPNTDFIKSSAEKTAVLFGVGVVIFILALYFIGIGKVYNQLLQLNLFYYALAICSVIVSIVFWALKWQTFIKANGFDVPFFEVFKNLIVGLGVNAITPIAKLGGEPVRGYLLKKKHGIKMRNGLATILADLTLQLITSMAIVIASIIIVTVFLEPPSWLLIVIIPFGLLSAVAFGGVLGIYAETDLVERLIKWFGRKVERFKPYVERVLERYREFQNTFRKTIRKKGVFTKAMFFGVMFKFFDFLKYFLIFLALGFNLSPLKLLVAMGFSAILLFIPATPGSLGIIESGMISIFILMGVPGNTAAAAVFLERLIWFWGIIIVGNSLGAYYGVDIINSESLEEYDDKIEGD